MGKALYRKYRSKRLAEIVGQEHITTTLSHALESGKVSHAYLFTGPRGVGKTSIARILAHELNGFPYTDDATHLDIIEIDAASNRRIDEIRDLRERVHTAPTSGKYKVYIIDEVHMLTKEAFNALLKTLEEPPAHVIFILATTEAHKLPDTIVSRTQRFTFKPITTADAVGHLQSIVASEKLQATPEALELIAKAGGGSFRDSISLLDQLATSGSLIDEPAVRQTLGIIPDEAIAGLVQALDSRQAPAVITAAQQLREAGYQATQIAQQLLTVLRERLLQGGDTNPIGTYQLLEKLLNIPTAHDPDVALDLLLLGITLETVSTPSRPLPSNAATAAAPAQPKQPAMAAPAIQNQPVAPKAPMAAAPAAPDASQPTPPEPAIVAATLPPDTTTEAIWQALLDALRTTYNTLYGIARMAEPQFSGTDLVLSFGFAFHQKRMNEPKNKQVLLDALQAITGQRWSITCAHSAKKSAPPVAAQMPVVSTTAPAAPPVQAAMPPQASTEPPATLAAISTIFGGAEVLDS